MHGGCYAFCPMPGSKGTPRNCHSVMGQGGQWQTVASISNLIETTQKRSIGGGNSPNALASEPMSKAHPGGVPFDATLEVTLTKPLVRTLRIKADTARLRKIFRNFRNFRKTARTFAPERPGRRFQPLGEGLPLPGRCMRCGRFAVTMSGRGHSWSQPGHTVRRCQRPGVLRFSALRCTRPGSTGGAGRVKA